MEQAKRATEEFKNYLIELIGRIHAGQIPFDAFLSTVLPDYFNRLNQVLGAFNAAAPVPITCAKGCAACCRPLVLISAIEAVYIWKRLKATKSAEELERLKAEIQKRDQVQKDLQAKGLTPEQLAEQYRRLEIPCQFLSPDQSCGVHEFRPYICRNLNVASDPRLCFDVDRPQAVQIWRHPSLWKLDMAGQKEFAKYYLKTDEMGLMQPMLLKYEKLP